MNENLADLCRYWASWQPERPAVRFDGRDTTWAELDAATDRVAAGLAATGTRRGDVVAILMGNRPEFIVAMIGALKAGAMVTPLNTRWTAHELVHPVVDSGASVVVTDADLVPRLELAAAQAELAVYCVDSVDGCRPFSDLLGAAPVDAIEIDPGDGAFICYTSGTTGFPKGAVLSHGAVRAGGLAKVVAEGITYRDRMLLPVPLAFTGGSVSMFVQMGLVPGATCVLEREFDPAYCLGLIETERINMMSVVPVILETMANLPAFESTDLSTLHSLTSGGSPVSLDLLQRWQSQGVTMTQAYGLTEHSGGATYLNHADAATRIGSAGRPAMYTSMRIVGPDDVPLDAHEVGEILLRSPMVMTEYRNRPEETAAALAGGWLHTGDMGLVDEDGFLHVVDRQKDMFISGGINVYPAEIERVLAGLPGLDELAVVGVPDPKWGEVPLLVVADLTAVDLDGVAARCTEQLADYKRPKLVVSHGGPLPRGLSGKVLKRELAEQYQDPGPAAVAVRRTVPATPPA